MSKRAKTVLIIAALYCVGFGSLLGYAVFLINEQGLRLQSEQEIIKEHTAKEASYTNVIRLIETTKSDRAELDTFFMTENDTVTFISEIERAASVIGVAFEPTGLSVTPAAGNTPAQLVVRCEFSGSEAGVKKFIMLLETIPYRMVMPQLTVTKKTETSEITGQAEFKITLRP